MKKELQLNESLAALGHGKWKHALRCTLLLIGVLALGGMNAWGQSYENGKLQLTKTFHPTKADNTEGFIWLETYVTGADISHVVAQPSDIVLVLDMSTSMSNSFGSTTRMAALNSAVSDFMTVVYNNDIPNAGTTVGSETIIGHRIAVVSFARDSQSSSGGGPGGGNSSYTQAWAGTNLLSTDDMVSYNGATSANYINALKEITSNNAINSALKTTTVNRIITSNEGRGTYAQYGLDMAYQILSNRSVTTFNAGTEEEPDMQPRSTIVVFFTDGYVGGQGTPDYFYWANNTSTSNNQTEEADAAVYQANRLKGLGAVVYSVGIYDSASPSDAYVTTYNSTSSSNGTTTAGYYRPLDEAANGMMHMVSSDYDYVENMAVPPYGFGEGPFQQWTTSNDNVENRFFYTNPDGTQHISKFFAANNQAGLSQIFTQIAATAQSDPIEMTAGTQVQDVISSSFDLPKTGDEYNVDDIEVYAVKCTSAEVDAQGNVSNCLFETEGADSFTDANGVTYTYGTKTSMDGGTILYLPRIISDPQAEDYGAIDEDHADGKENRLKSSDIIAIVMDDDGNPQVNITGFNFKAMYCGMVTDETTGEDVPCGRKLVVKIPIKVREGVWGDNFNTNGQMSLVQPDGSTTQYFFENPITNVVGSVWVEEVTSKPSTFVVPEGENPIIPLYTPEDLAWFISYVNGYNGSDKHESANAQLMKDIDMSAHNWVPIGNISEGYTGTFDGNGHTITGLKNNASKYFKKVSGDDDEVLVFPGMFSDVHGTVKNVFVLSSDFRARNHQDEGQTFIHFGIIADTLSSGGQIFNCEAVGSITCNDDADNREYDALMKFGGLVGLNAGGTIHSSMAMPTLTGYTMGGMIAENNGSFSNGFTNPVFNYLDNDYTKPVGGIAGENTSNIANCYVRFSRESSKLNKATFGQVVGSGSYTEESCYTPLSNDEEHEMVGGSNKLDASIPLEGRSSNLYSNTRNPGHMRGDRSNDNMVGGEWVSVDGMYVLMNGTPMLTKLNEGKGDNGTSWKRTTAGGYYNSPNGGNINGDYPVLEITDYTCLAANNGGIGIDYAATLDEMLDRHNTYTVNTQSTWGDNKYKDTEVDALKGGAINLYANGTTSKGTDATAGTMVYIDENISLLQTSTDPIDAYTGQTLIDYGSNYDPQSGNRWHNVSSSLQNSVFGWTYNLTGQEHSWDSNPCDVWVETSNDDQAIFPADMRSTAPYDFYCFLEREYHWINFKRSSDSHWHMDNYYINIPYPEQETSFVPGKGYLLAIHFEYFANWHVWNGTGKDRTFLQNRGTLNNGNVDIPVTYTTDAIIDLDGYKTGLEGYNLLGNPYQSYLDFDAFVEENAELMANSKFANTYAVYDPNNDKYIQYLSGASKGAYTASRYINMHQGFFIQVNASDTVTFTNDMRTLDTDAQTGFRGEQPTYPLINFTVTDYEGETDLAVLELNRPENDGAKKLRMGSPAGRIYFRYDNTNLAIYFRNSDKDYQTLNFSAEEDGNFTLSWNMANADFSSLTLVDNITGIKTDMLTHDHYTFEGRMDDYNTRFKIVFGEMNTNDEEEPVLEHFAFFDHGNLIVNGTGHFEVVDVMGRVLYAVELTDTQNTVSLPSNVRGVCMLCFTRNNETKVQKMVIQ